jgi:metal-responsive CopG/Arc/MetJ family transcriptional regulator
MASPFTVYLPIKISPQMLHKLDDWAKELRKSRSAIVRALISRATVADLPHAWRDIREEER